MSASNMKSIQTVLLDSFNALGICLKTNIEFDIDSNYHEIECENETVFYIIDIYFPYIALYGLENGIYGCCRSLEYNEMSVEYKRYDMSARERMTSLFERVKNKEITVDHWGNTDIDINDEYKVEHEWPVPNPNFRLDKLLKNIKDAIHKFVDIDTYMATIITLWVVFTWTLEHYNTSPLLIIKNDDDHYDSKFALLRLILHLTKNAVRASAFGTRVFLEEYKYNEHTVLFDDSSAIKSRELLNLLINSRTRSYATKCIKKNNNIDSFDTFGAKALVCDGDIPKPLMQNGITIHFGVQCICSRPSQITESDQESLDNLCYELEYFAEHYDDFSVKAELQLPDYLSNSEKGNWEPLFEIAMIAGDTWVNKAMQAAQTTSSTLHQDSIIRQQLLNDAYNVVKARKSDKIRTKTLISCLSSITDKPWATYNRGANITSEQLAKLLKKFNIRSKNMRFKSSSKGVNTLVKKGYEKGQIVEAYNAFVS